MCSSKADDIWQAKCPVLTAKNKDYLPMKHASDADINVDETVIEQSYDKARALALKHSGNIGNIAMSGMRKKSRTWYQQSLGRLFTYFCINTGKDDKLSRCVADTSPYAAKLASDDCYTITDADGCMAQGKCERRGNCKWDDPVDGASFRRALFSSDDVSAAKKWVERDYPTSFAPLIAPGIVFSVLTAITCVGFFVLRCVFNQCGGRNPNEKGYTRCDILIPTLIFAGCSFAVFVCSVVTVAQNTNITEGVGTILSSLNTTLENIDIFALNLQKPLQDAQTSLRSASLLVGTLVNEMDWIQKDGQTLREMITRYGEIYTHAGPFPFKDCNKNKSTCVSCPDAVCGKPIRDFVADGEDTLNTTSGPIARAVGAMQEAFVQHTGAISRGILSASNQINEVARVTLASKETVNTIKQTFDNYSFSRAGLVMFVFLIGMFSSLLGLFGILKGLCIKKSAWVQLLHASWLMATLVCIIGFVLASSLLAVAAVWYDSCNYLNIIRSDTSPYFPTMMSNVMNACLNDSSLLTPLGLDQHVAFSCAIQESYVAVGKTDFSAQTKHIDSFGELVANHEIKNFGFNSTASRTYVANANAAFLAVTSKSGFTQENILEPWTLYKDAHETAESAAALCPELGNSTNATDMLPVCYVGRKCDAGTGPQTSKDKCKLTFTNAYYYVLAFNKISNMLDEMREDLLGDTGKGFSEAWQYDVSLREFAVSYYNRLVDVHTSVLEVLMDGEVGRMLDSIDKVRCSSNCGWINISYNAVYSSLCQDVLGTTMAIALSVLFLTLFLIPMIVSGITLQKRLRGEKKGSYQELELRLHELETKSKEEARAKAEAAKGSSRGIDLSFFKKGGGNAGAGAGANVMPS
ncbi:TPA: hypothetical protein N0F65_008677 [Lagenidium giganteum]|uniref:Uncharacterized protein n=1 Tax=Lagenidium giganteum TaxID=4803 RepID=A0AAV2ZB84_9STRA|nr:TPA: hypothetical protein N0F65_008677 [Lagenidium giganteum]